MEQTRAIQKLERSNPAIFDQAFTNLMELQKLSEFLLGSGMCPDHFYEKTPDGKADRQKGKVAALGMTLLHGNDLGLPAMTAMQWIVQVNGLMSIKGDGAKALINSSGKLLPGSWVEDNTGSISEGNFKVCITAQRSDTKESLTRSFSMQEAKRAGLWINEQQINSKDGWKFKKSPWYKYPERMIYYRALGFLARDMFSDVLYGTYTTEEAMDIPQDTEIVIETIEGNEIKIPDKEFNEERSQKLTAGAVDKIDKAMEYPMTPEESEPAPTGNLSGTARPVPDAETLKGKLMDMTTDEMKQMILKDSFMEKAMSMIPGKNSHKKLRNIIYQHRLGTLHIHIEQNDPTANPDLNDASTIAKMPNMGVELEPEPVEAKEPQIDITELQEDGTREFHDVKSLYEDLSTVIGIDSKRFAHLVETKLTDFSEFRDKEDFCTRATPEQIEVLINAI